MNSQFTKIIRLVLGILLVVFGSNKFLHFIPLPPPSGAAGDLMTSMGASGYIFQTVGALEVVIGLMFLFKKWVAFGLILLAPISVNILLFHLFLDIPGVGVALLVSLLNGVLIYKHWKQYKPIFA